MKLTKNEALEKRNSSEALAKGDKRLIVKITLLVLSIAGFFDSSYLTISHYKNTIPPCEIAKGCETVLTSQFSTIAGIPIALIGALYFLTLIFLILSSTFQNRTDNSASTPNKKVLDLLNQKKFLRYFKILILLGVLVSVNLFFIQAFVLKAFCQYCLLVEGIILAIFVLIFLHKEKPEA